MVLRNNTCFYLYFVKKYLHYSSKSFEIASILKTGKIVAQIENDFGKRG